MLKKIFPAIVDNTYVGKKVALWFFIPITILTLGRSLVHIFAPDGGAGSIATIPLDAFTANGSAAVILTFAYWGLSQLLMGLLYVLVLVKYRSLLTLMYLLLTLEYTLRLVLGRVKPIETLGTAPGATGNLILAPLSLLFFILSLLPAQNN